MNFFQKVYKVVSEIPEGKVATYGQIAGTIGNPKSARQVGYALRALTLEEQEVPWWRVINSKGYLSIRRGEGIEKDVQADLLREEGIGVDEEYRIDLKKHLWYNGEVSKSKSE